MNNIFPYRKGYVQIGLEEFCSREDMSYLKDIEIVEVKHDVFYYYVLGGSGCVLFLFMLYGSESLAFRILIITLLSFFLFFTFYYAFFNVPLLKISRNEIIIKEQIINWKQIDSIYIEKNTQDEYPVNHLIIKVKNNKFSMELEGLVYSAYEIVNILLYYRDHNSYYTSGYGITE